MFDYGGTAGPELGARIRQATQGRVRAAVDCVADEGSVGCCYGAIGRPGGRVAVLEACRAEWKTRATVRADMVMSLEAFGAAVELAGDYGRAASEAKHRVAVRAFGRYQHLLDRQLLRPHPTELVGRGLAAVVGPAGLQRLRAGDVSGAKLVVLVGDEVGSV